MPTASEIARRLPLITVTKIISFEKGRTHHALSSVKPASIARKVENLCEISPGKYYFAAIAVPDFGPIVLVYSPEAESDVSGSANPFDTGGTLVGRCRPFEDIEDDNERSERARELIRQTLQPLDTWRDVLEDYLERYYSDPEEYVRGTPPNIIPDDAHEDLPARFDQRPGDRRSFTWEVRLYEGRRIDEYLKCWATGRGTRTALMEAAAMTELPTTATPQQPTLAQCLVRTEKIIRRTAPEACSALQARVEEEVLQ